MTWNLSNQHTKGALDAVIPDVWQTAAERIGPRPFSGADGTIFYEGAIFMVESND